MGQDIHLFGERAGETAAKSLTAAGCDGYELFVRGEEFGDWSDSRSGFVQGIKSELEELRVSADCFRALQELVNCASTQGYADPPNAGPEVSGRRNGCKLRHTAMRHLRTVSAATQVDIDDSAGVRGFAWISVSEPAR